MLKKNTKLIILIMKYTLLQTLEYSAEQAIPLIEIVVRDEELRNIWTAGLHPKSRGTR